MRTVEEAYDVVVCGGGLAGFSAAVAAARHGARTALIQDRPVLGGNSSSEVRVTPHGAAAFHGYARETGIISEALIADRAVNHAVIRENGWTNSVWDLVLYDMAVRTPNLTLHLNTAVHGVQVDGERITAVLARVANAETEMVIAGRVVIDCTGDGTVAALAGAESRTGTEAADEFDEQHAPATADIRHTMGSSLHFKTVDTGRPVRFEAPEWAHRYDDPSFFKDGGRLIPTLESGYWWIEIGTPWDTLHDNETIRHELTRHVLGIWDYLKNRDPYWSAKATNLALDWVGQVPGKRESRRILGEVLLTEHDLDRDRVFEDEIAFGGWYIDLHTIGGLLEKVAEPVTTARLADPESSSGSSTYVGPFGIPMRALVAKDLSNLMMAGRNISATHVALGSTRVMGTAALMGQAAGTAAAMASNDRDLRQDLPAHVPAIQQALLRDGCFLPHVRNEDPADLALRTTATASSTDLVRGVGPSSANWLGGLDHWRGYPVFPFKGELAKRLAQWVAVGPGQRVELIRLALRNGADEPRAVSATLHDVEDIWDYRLDPAKPLATADLLVPPGGPHWVEWRVDLDADADQGLPSRYVRVDLAETADVEWVLSSAVLPGQIAGYEDGGRYRRFGGGSTLSFQVEPPQQSYGPDQVLTGVTRPHASANQWRSDPVVPLPQWLCLEWEQAQTVAQVQLTFAGHLLREYHAYPPLYRDPQTVRDYAIEAWQDDAWCELVRVQGNVTTRVVHAFDPVTTTRVRLVVYATNGDPAAGVYEFRCYGSEVCTPNVTQG
ncbi:FAD-dependent oxidoreductase [Mycobacterium sp. NPDC003323]